MVQFRNFELKGEIILVQQPKWEIKGKNESIHRIQAVIRKGHIKVKLNNDTIVEKHISGHKNIISFTVFGRTFSLQLINKPVGGYKYELYDFERKKLKASDPNITVASPDYVPKSLFTDIDETKAHPAKKVILKALLIIGLIFGAIACSYVCHFLFTFGWLDFL